MVKKFKKISGVLLIILLSILLYIAVLYIWEVIDMVVFKDVLWKTTSTFGLVYIIFLVMTFISRKAVQDGS